MILKKIAKKLLDCDAVVRVEFLGTKVRAYLIDGYILDIYYNSWKKVQLNCSIYHLSAKYERNDAV